MGKPELIEHLEKLRGSQGTLIDENVVRTSVEDPSQNIEEIRDQMEQLFEGELASQMEDEDIDIGVAYYYSLPDENSQDLDNILKRVMSALDYNQNHPEKPYLVEDDSQIKQVVMKREMIESGEYDEILLVSYREHTEELPMEFGESPLQEDLRERMERKDES